MLVLTRKLGETILIGDNIRVTIVSRRGNNIRVGVESTDNTLIVREEITTRPDYIPGKKRLTR